MPAWSVHRRISPCRFREVGLIVDTKTIEKAMEIATFILDLAPTDVRLIPHD